MPQKQNIVADLFRQQYGVERCRSFENGSKRSRREYLRLRFLHFDHGANGWL
jgi:hypothetical protein